MPWNEIAAGILLTVLLAVAIEIAEVSSRLADTPLRYADRLAPSRSGGMADRIGGLVLAAAAIWFFALPWVQGSQEPAIAFTLFLATCTVGIVLLRRIHSATVRYPAATAAPLMAVAFATAMT